MSLALARALAKARTHRLRPVLALLVSALFLGVGSGAPVRHGGSPAPVPVAAATAAPVLVSLPIAPDAAPRLPLAHPDPRPWGWIPQRWLPGHLLVVYYGNPDSARMGILGQGKPAWVLQRLRAQAAAYQKLTKKPVQPAIDLVTVVAQGSPQRNGSYSLRMPASLVGREIGFAKTNHMPIFLDVQVGRSTVPAEVRALAPYLRQPDVELALDPEFDMPPGERPGQRIGTMSASAINWAIGYLSGLVRQDHLPDKLLIVHQWTHDMVPGWRSIRPLPGVQLIMDMDGFGAQQTKRAFYGLFVRDETIPGRFGGIKLFYTQDHPLFQPAQVLQLKPTPSLVMYQ